MKRALMCNLRMPYFRAEVVNKGIRVCEFFVNDRTHQRLTIGAECYINIV